MGMSHYGCVLVMSKGEKFMCFIKKRCRPVRKYAPYCQFFVNHSGLNLCDDVRQLGLISQDGVCYDIYDLPENFVVKGDLVLRGMNLTALMQQLHYKNGRLQMGRILVKKREYA